MHKKFEIRSYQLDALNAIKDAKDHGISRQILHLPPGSGKSFVFVRVPSHLGLKKKTLLLVHRDFLVSQAERHFREANPDVKLSIEMASSYADFNSDVIIASIATLGRRDLKRLSRFNPADFSLIIADECHRTAAWSWLTVLSYFDVLPSQENKHDILSLGVSGTPFRHDERGLDNVYDQVVYKEELLDLIERGYLVRPKAFKIETKIDISAVPTNKHDFISYELDKVINTDERNVIILNAYKKHLLGKQAIAFCNSIAHTKELSKLFNEAGVLSSCIDYTTKDDARTKIFTDFTTKKINVIFNVAVCTEGLDLPITDAILYCKSTKSLNLYIQSITRSLRLYPGKTEAVILDFMDMTDQHSLASLPSMFGLPFEFDLEGKDLLKTLKRLKELKAENPRLNLGKLKNLDEVEFKATEVFNLFNLKKEDNQGDYSKLPWMRMFDGSWRLCLTNTDKVKTWFSVGHINGANEVSFLKFKEVLSRSNTLQEAFKCADKYISLHHAQEYKFLRTKHPWQQHPPTSAQVNYVASMSTVTRSELQKLNKGVLSLLISKIVAHKELQLERFIEVF